MFEHTYIIIFLIPFLFIFKNFDISDKYDFFIWYLYIFFLIIYVGFRFEVGGDWLQYLFAIEQKKGQPFIPSLRGDIGYEFLIFIISYLDLSILTFNLITAIIFILGLSSFALKQPCPWSVMAIASSYLIVVAGMGYSRQSLAMGFGLFATKYLIDKKFYKSIILLLLGSLFHISLLIYGIMYLAIIKFNKNLIYLGFIIILLLYIVLNFEITIFQLTIRMQTLINYFIFEGNQIYLSKGSVIRLGIGSIAAILFILFYKNYTTDVLERKIFLIMSFFVIFLFIISFNYSVFADRLNIYFMTLQLYVFSRTPYVFKKIINIYFTKIIIIFVYLTILLIWLITSQYTIMWIPYQNYLLPHTSKFECNSAFHHLSIVKQVVCK